MFPVSFIFSQAQVSNSGPLKEKLVTELMKKPVMVTTRKAVKEVFVSWLIPFLCFDGWGLEHTDKHYCE